MPRRTFLKGAGVALLLPRLESLGQVEEQSPRRLLTIVNHLSFYQPALIPKTDGAFKEPPPLLAEVPAGAWHVRLPKLSHGNFNFPGGMLPGVLALEEVSDWAVGGETARHGYETVCRLALEFLDAVVRESAPAPEAVEGNGFVEIRRHPPHAEN